MLSVIYGLVTPPWEGYDEWWHFEYICFLHQNLRLPTTAEQQARPNSEIKQLPLYYVVGAALTGWIDLRDCSVPARNWNFGTAGAGINFVLHDPARESFPYQDSKLIALHITRLFSTFVGAFGIIFVNHLARTILPDRPRLVWLATALTAFQPQYIYLASILNNDILAIVAVTGLLAASVRLIVEGLNTKTMVWWGLALILAMSSKLNAVSAIPAAGLAVVFGGLDWLEQRGIARRTIWFGVGSVIVLVGIGLLVYFQISLGPAGQPEPWLPSVGYLLDRLAHPSSLRWDRIAPAILHGFYTYWGAFGFGSIPLPQWLYGVIGVLCGLAAIGMVPVWQSANRSLRRVLAAFALLGFVTLLLPLTITLDSGYIYIVVGRYLLPCIGVVSIGLVLGWRALLPEAISGRLSSIPGAVSHLPVLTLFILAAVIPWGLIAPAYRLPQLITALPNEVTPVDFRFGDSMRLVGYSIDADLHPREIATVKLCWESLAATSVNYTVSVALLGRQLAPVAKLDSIPGNGNYPTSIWVPGRLFCDSYPLTLPPVVEQPALGRIAVAAYEFDGDTKTIKDYLPIFNSQSDPVSAAIMGRVKLHSDAAQASQHECVKNLSNRSAVYSFPQEGIQLLVAVDRSKVDEVAVAMCWLAQGRPSRAYTAFVHLTPQNAPGTLLMQADGEPGQGDYPTDLWESGDQVSDVRQLSIASDSKLALVVEIGLYDLETGERLSVLDADQTVLPDNSIRLAVPEDN